MLKVYIRRHYVSVNGGEWYEVGDCDDVMLDESESKAIVFENWSFDQWYEYLQNPDVPMHGIYASKTFFGKKPCIVTHNWCYETYEKYMRFDALSYKIAYKEVKDASLSYIMDNFPADQCIQYLKERGITTCPMNF